MSTSKRFRPRVVAALGRARRPDHPLIWLALPAAFALALLAGGRDGPSGEDPGGQGEQPPIIVAGFAPFASTLSGEPQRDRLVVPPAAAYPDDASVRAAKRFAKSRAGLVSFAVVDSRGRAHGWRHDRRYVSASIVKAPLMVAELRRQAGGVDEGTRGLLNAMVTVSDNDSADAIYTRVGDSGLTDVARRTGMDRFTVQGHWGNAFVTAADLASFMSAYE
ncbi:MAG: serine hydrolase, partial [Solirubrobacterales bacterium]